MIKFKKVAAVILAVTAATSMVACGKKGPDVGLDGRPIESVDTNKTQLYISNFNGGYGDEWLYKLKDRFEAFYKDASFEEGKTGVQVYIENSKTFGFDLVNSIKGDRNDIYFTEAFYYHKFLEDDLLLDISDVLTVDLATYGDTGTVEDKMYEEQVSYLKQSSGAMYALPHYAAYQGIIYDKDLFESEDYLFYLAADPTKDANTTKANACFTTGYDNGNEGFILSKTETKSNGPDGKPGTMDDGLPATYAEYFALCDYMVGAGCTPVLWTGEHQNDYNLQTLKAFYTDYEGKDQSMINVTYNGVKKNLINVAEDGTITKLPDETITLENAYKLTKSAGYYYALEFFEKLVSKTNYYNQGCFNSTVSHLGAQTDFLLSRPLSAAQGKPIGMLFEGFWWENEADASFRDIAGRYGDQYSRSNRKLGLMPFPKATADKVGEKTTLLDGNAAFCFANAQTTKKDLVVKFLAFANTQQSLEEFTKLTATPKAYKYELSQNTINGLSNFAKEAWNVVESADAVFPYANTSVYQMHTPNIYSLRTSKVGSTVINNLVLNMRATRETHYSAEQLFNGLQNYYTQSYWQEQYL